MNKVKYNRNSNTAVKIEMGKPIIQCIYGENILCHLQT